MEACPGIQLSPFDGERNRHLRGAISILANRPSAHSIIDAFPSFHYNHVNHRVDVTAGMWFVGSQTFLKYLFAYAFYLLQEHADGPRGRESCLKARHAADVQTVQVGVGFEGHVV
jgi:hypothetical protein